MKKRILCLGLLVAVTQLFVTGCCCHPIASRWRANHPYGICGTPHPLMHPVQTRRMVQGDPVGPVGPVVTNPPCHGCGPSSAAPGVPIIIGPKSGAGVPVTPSGYPVIGYPMPIAPGPTVVPTYPLPAPMPVAPKTGDN